MVPETSSQKQQWLSVRRESPRAVEIPKRVDDSDPFAKK